MADHPSTQHHMIGIGVLVIRDGKVLLGRRKGAHGAGTYAPPGGHLEHLESFTTCAQREVAEECGIEIENIRFQSLANIKEFAPRHYVQITLVADWKNGEPKVLEPEKCEGWTWYTVDTLPSPLFAAVVRSSIEDHFKKTGRNYYDA